jgi:hypothetical protein
MALRPIILTKLHAHNGRIDPQKAAHLLGARLGEQRE